ncbi:MAG TPA: ABC transporter ATP-binding protein [Polyangiaceae bacterium]|nr:ABC transporter ATP-binding protein [Polyangiaceae bacterium]
MSVTVSGLTKRFGPKSEAAAAADVCFEAPTGRITSLLGPSGSGKSTVLRLIAGLEEPDQGQIHIDGVDCTTTPARSRGVGFAFQSYALFQHMTVNDNIGFGLKIRKAPRAEIAERVNDLLGLVQLQGYGDRFPNQLSGGQRQRIALARALATRPKVLLLDEPFGALDARVRVELREWLAEFQEKTGVTTLLVTHDQEEALELSEHVVLLQEGKVVQTGSPHDVYDKPATPFVASFLGGANVLRGHIKDGRADIGSFAVDGPPGSLNGASVRAFVRPHDIRIEKASEEPAAPVQLAKVERITRIGGQVKLAVRLATGDSVTVQMPKTEIDQLGIEQGDRVMVDLKEAKVFVEDYTI